MARLVTAIIGAGPAGLLVALATSVLASRSEADVAVLVFDKREHYERTHRLRMDPAPYRELGKALEHAGYDALLQWLTAEDFRPAINELEARLSALVEAAGVHKAQLQIGAGPDAVDLAGLRATLEADGRLGPGDRFVVVAADSVHSETRELVRGDEAPTAKVHQLVARLRVEGADLPESLPLVQQLKLSKLIGSILDYRRNPAGHAEVDLFLDAREHERVDGLGAHPKSPVLLETAAIAELRAPLFAKIVEYLRDDFGAGPNEVTLWSTFVLEHKHMPRVVFTPDGLDLRVFLVGDAAVSLPFFRGMACLGRCALLLGQTLVASAESSGSDAERIAARYQTGVAKIREDEVAIVEARARLIRGTREFVRISALLPFPVQSWFLSVPDDSAPGWRLTPGVVLNLVVATSGLAVAIAAPLLAPAIADDWPQRLLIGGGLYLATAILQVLGGLLYRHTRNLDAGAAHAARGLWTLQMLGLILGGAAIGVSSPWRGSGLQVVPAISFLAFAGCFVVGILIYEALERRWWNRAAL